MRQRGHVMRVVVSIAAVAVVTGAIFGLKRLILTSVPFQLT